MIRYAWFPRSWLIAAGLGVGLVVDRAEACAVCFGDPESDMARGVVAGVLVLFGVVVSVLAGVAATGLMWVQRSRRLARLHAAEEG